MQVDRILGEHARVLEDDRADRRLAAPVGELLVLLAGRAQRVEGRSPTRIRLRAAIQRGKSPDPAPIIIGGLGERFRSKKLKRAGERLPERCGFESRPSAGALEQSSTAFDLCLQILLALACGLEFLPDQALLRLIEVRLVDLTR